MTINSQPEETKKIEIRYFSDKQVSQLTGKAVQTLRNERSRRIGIPYIRMGGAIRYDIQDVTKYMDERKVQIER